jgi:ornithine decarboxylase
MTHPETSCVKIKVLQEEYCVQIVNGTTNVDAIIRDLTNCSIIHDDEPFYVFDIGDIVRKHEKWVEKMPRVIPYYAVKCNDNGESEKAGFVQQNI